MNPLELRYSTVEAEGLLKVSKFLAIQFLIDQDEMQELIASLPEFHMIASNGLSQKGKGLVDPESFLKAYGLYIQDLKNGSIPDPKSYRAAFYDSWTTDLGILYAVPVAETQQVIKSIKPTLQVQAHSMSYSQADGRFRPMGMGKNCIHWGLQISYPQLYQDPETQQVEKIDDSERFPNTKLFRSIQQWIRKHTVPTPFEVNGKRSNVPMRLGKACLDWIHHHPQLREQGIRVLSELMQKEKSREN